MRGYSCLVLLLASVVAGCAPTANVEEERAKLLAVDREWSESATDIDKFLSYFAPDASAYPPGMPVATGTAAIRERVHGSQLLAGVLDLLEGDQGRRRHGGDVGYTVGTYTMSMAGATEAGKDVTVWKKQSDGSWKVAEDIFNADAAPKAPAATHVMRVPVHADVGRRPTQPAPRRQDGPGVR